MGVYPSTSLLSFPLFQQFQQTWTLTYVWMPGIGSITKRCALSPAYAPFLQRDQQFALLLGVTSPIMQGILFSIRTYDLLIVYDMSAP
jgi:hypothetical protein